MIVSEEFLRCGPDLEPHLIRRIRPIADSLPKQTWRAEGWRHVQRLQDEHRYPTAGCHGGPLEADHPSRTNGP